MIPTAELLGGGLGVALVTPFDARGRVDAEALARLVDHVVDGGADFLVALGSTAEANALDEAERDVVLDVVAARRGGARVVVGVSSPSTAQATAWARSALARGADGALLSAPAYARPTQEGIRAYFAEVAGAAGDLAFIAYNVPSRTGVGIAAETAVELLRLPNVLALKESSGDIGQISRIAAALPPERAVLAGDDALTLPTIAVGGRGVVSVAANAVPASMRRLVSAALEGAPGAALAEHRCLVPLFDALSAEPNPVPIKAALAQLGLAAAEPRLPLIAAQESTRAALVPALAATREVLQHA